ncbi:MAG: hypothetical protein AAF984_03350 [Verrucomicrobiota bacterium]
MMFIKYPLIIVFTFSLTLQSIKAEERPNILWIFTDDHATQAFGAYGGHLEAENITPNLGAQIELPT